MIEILIFIEINTIYNKRIPNVVHRLENSEPEPEPEPGEPRLAKLRA
jgi:hypothetical protein